MKLLYYLWLTIRVLIGYIFIGLVGLICFFPCFTIACLPQRWRHQNKLYYFFVQLFYQAALKASCVPITIKGLENLPKRPVIFAANHQSSLDIPLLGSLVGTFPHVWLFYVRYAKVPIFGFIVRRMNVVVDPSGLRKLVASLNEAARLVEGKDRHVMIFPEGGRYTDSKVHNFFYGFAVLAKKLHRPVIPVLLKNVGDVYPPGSFLLYPEPITITIGQPIHFKEHETEEEFLQRVHAWFLAQNGDI